MDECNKAPARAAAAPVVFAAAITPCVSPGVPDPEGLGALSARLLAGGCDGLFVVSSTGEMPFLDDGDRRCLIKAVRDLCPGETPVYAGISGTGVRQTLRYATAAAQAGADAGITMAPFFVRLSQSQLLEYCLRIADGSPIPVGFYHHLRMPTAFEIETVATLAQHPNVIAFKDTSADEKRFRLLAKAVDGTGLRLFQGSEKLLLSSLRAGGSGATTALANIVPEWHRSVIDAWMAGSPEAAARSQDKIVELWRAFQWPESQTSFAHFVFVMKYLLSKRGWLRSTATMIPGFDGDAVLQSKLDRLWDSGLFSDLADSYEGAATNALGSPPRE